MFVDIKKAASPEGEKFFVDTNVWYWTTYIPSKEYVALKPDDYQTEHYPQFIEDALNNKSTLYYSPLMLAELAGLIERSELAIYRAFHGEIKLKRFRSIKAERSAVIGEIRSAWETINQIASPLPANIDTEFSEKLLEITEKNLVDGYDALYYFVMRENGLQNIITDDKDFKGIPDINLYSCYPGN